MVHGRDEIGSLPYGVGRRGEWWYIFCTEGFFVNKKQERVRLLERQIARLQKHIAALEHVAIPIRGRGSPFFLLGLV